MLAGGWAETPITDHHHHIVGLVTVETNAKLGGHHTFTLVEVRHQIVAGTNYQFKLLADDGRHVEVKVFEPLPHTGLPP